MTERPRMVSYAQNFEDVILWRALGQVPQGTYIDIGAAWPRHDSVTCWFYEQGWSGVNVEPNPDLFDQLQRERARDINLRVAVSSQRGTALFNIVSEPGLSTLDASVAEDHTRGGRSSLSVESPTARLSEVWESNLGAERDVHFLKIDVEGFEFAVIASSDWRRLRPWVVVVEAIHPVTTEPSHHEWEPLLLGADYEYVYWDGLNRFYLATEHSDLRDRFRTPPNILDGFVSVGQQDAENSAWALHVEREQNLRLSDPLFAQWREWMSTPGNTRQQQQAFLLAEVQAVSLKIDLAAVEQALAEQQSLRDNLAATQELLDAVVRSKAWRLTRPLRILRGAVGAPRLYVGKLARRCATALAPLLARHPRLRRITSSVARFRWKSAPSDEHAAAAPRADTQRYLALLPEPETGGQQSL